MFAATRATPIHTTTADNTSSKLSLGAAAAPVVLAAVLLLSLALAAAPHAAWLSSHTWRVELAAGVFLFGALAVGPRLSLASTLSGRIVILLAFFALWGLISGAWARSFAAVIHHTIVWCEYILFFTLASEILRTRGRGFILATFSWFVTLIGLITVSDYVSLPDFKTLEGTLRIRYSAYGELTIAILPLLWIAACYRLRIRSWLITLVPAALGWTAAMLSLSKGVFIGGIVGFVFAFVTALLFGRSLHRRRLLATAAIWLALTFAVQAGFSLLSPIPATVDYISGKADPTRETSTARVFIWRTTVPIVRAHWLVGVGADNYGIVANEGREAYRSTHPTDPADEPIADFLFERSHNEPLQVLLELGVCGLILFLAPFALFVWSAVTTLSRGERPSVLFWAACGGMTAFAASSMVSSFSFRIVQNGTAFFLVYAIAVYELSRVHRTERNKARSVQLPKLVTASLLVLIVSVLGLKGFAEYTFAAGDQTTDPGSAAVLFARSATLDPDYAAAHYRLSRVHFAGGDYINAADELRRAIADGLGVVLTYSNLAECYEKAGDQEAEFRTFDKALRIYPRSAFLRVRYAIELAKASRTDAADEQLATAREIDLKQANGWYSLITRGSVRTFYDSLSDVNIAPPAKLRPEAAVIQYLDKNPE